MTHRSSFGVPRRLTIAATAVGVILALSLASRAAAQGSSAFVSATASSGVGELRPSGTTTFANTTDSSSATNGVASIAVHNESTPSGANSAGATAGGTAGIGHLGVSGSSSAVATTDNNIRIGSTTVIAGMSDLVTLRDFNHSSTRSSVIWIGSLDLSGSLSGSGSAASDGGRASSGYSGTINVAGTGVTPCPFSSCGSTDVQVTDTDSGHSTVTRNSPVVTQLQWILPLNLDSPTPIALSLSLIGQAVAIMDVSDGNGAAVSTFSGDFAHTLKWGQGGHFVDAVTGETIEGLSLTSASGFDYFHPHFDDDVPAGVPEPATWALLICGFGLAGVGLRRKRHAVALAAA